MLKIVIIVIGIINLLIGIISSLKHTVNKNKEKTEDKIKVKRNELIALEGVTYIFLASVSIRTGMSSYLLITLFMLTQVIFFLMLLKELKRGNDGE